MRMTLKRLTAWMLTLMMIVGSVPASAVEGSVVDYSAATSAYDVMPLDGTTEDTITITFVIDNEYYVKDPNSGNTHLRVLKTTADAFEGGDLTYTEWTGTDYYKITSTGTVCTVSIPSGSSLTANSLSTPALEVINCNDVATPQDGYRYFSMTGWVTEDGMVCNANTTFTEDMTLYLQLDDGKNTPFYTIDFVCGDEDGHNHSIDTSGPFQLGQTLSENYITEATIAANSFTSDYCTYGPASGEVLSAWQLHNYTTDSRVDLTTGLEITSDYATTEYGSAIKAYAVWEPGVEVTFKIANQYVTFATQTLLVKPGSKFGDIQGIPNPNNYIRDTFIGWQYTDSNGNLQYATEDTVVSAGMEFNAICGTPVYARFQYTYFDETTQGYITETVEERARLSGDTLGTLPTLTVYGIDSVSWQYMDSTGALQTATADTVITADTTFTAVINESVTATFQYTYTDEATGTETTETIVREVSSGAALGELPDMSAYTTPYWVFKGWQYTDSTGAIQTATADTVITADTIFTALFEEPNYGNVIFHDILPDGSERLSIDFDVPEGMTLTWAIEENDSGLADATQESEADTLISECIWRTATNGELADLNATVVADNEVHLYTHTYQIILTLNPQSAAEAAGIMTLSLVETDTAEDGTITMTITAREGETLTEEDLTVNDIDLTQYAWTDSEGNAVDLQALVDEGVTESITATSDGTLAADEYTLTLTLTLDGETKDYVIKKATDAVITVGDFVIDGVDLTVFTWKDGETEVPLADLVGTSWAGNRTLTSDGMLNNGLVTKKHIVNFYVYIDNEPVRIARKTVDSYWIESGKRYYISAATLAAVYGKYEFKASDMTTETDYFPHTDVNSTKIWADSDVVEYDGAYYSPIISGTGIVDVYYLPNQLKQASYDYNDDNGATIEANSFYTVSVFDPLGLVYTADTLPETTITYNGKDTSMTVQKKDGIVWKCVGVESGKTITASPDSVEGMLTYNIDSIDEPYVISPEFSDAVVVKYDLNLPYSSQDDEYGVPQVNGEDAYVDALEMEEAGKYVLLAPDPTSYFYERDKYLNQAVFAGWVLNGDATKVFEQGTEVDLSAYNGQVVTLTAQWTIYEGGFDPKLNSSIVNFYVSLEAVSEGTSEWQGKTKTDNFTGSVYSMDCGILGQDAITYELYEGQISGETQYSVLGNTSGNDLNGRHELIVDSLTAGHSVTGTDDKTYTYKGTFPSEESVLRTVRQMVESGTEIKINNRVIKASELTTSNFTIRWYVFKLAYGDYGDGWHIDGILVAKSAELVVTKTFAGDPETIKTIKEGGYSITVAGGSGLTENKGGTLTVDNADSVSGNTYTWVVPVDQYYDYTVTETNYLPSDTMTTSMADYRVSHSVNGQNTAGWLDYEGSGITVTGQGHSEDDDERLTVGFRNTYTAPGTVVLQKMDAATGNLMPYVDFDYVSGVRTDGTAASLYPSTAGEGHYTADADSNLAASTEAVETITTDSTGQAYLWVGGGTYMFKEVVPDGYDDPGTITAVLRGENETSYKVVAITSASSANEESTGKDFVTTGGDDKLTLIVKNYSRTVDLTVTKIWPAGETEKPVYIQLYRDGKTLGDDYLVSFATGDYVDGTSSSSASYTFYDLPLYADGGLAQYSIREESIGESKYSAEYAGGYRYYDVDYSGMRYLDEDGNLTDDMTAVETIALDVTNKRNSGSLTLRKVDENGQPLAGATFATYDVFAGEDSGSTSSAPDLSGLDAVRTIESDDSGNLTFTNLDAGRYYLKETTAPDGYVGSETIYCLEFSGEASTLTYWDGDSWETVANKAIVNTSKTTSIKVDKVWSDYGNVFGTRPDSITLTLTGKVGEGEAATVVSVKSITLSTSAAVAVSDDTELIFLAEGASDEAWSHTFTNLPTHYGGQAITYTVNEQDVDAAYTSKVTGDATNGYTVTNTLKTYSVNVAKKIEGNFADPNKVFTFTAKLKDASGNYITTITNDTFTNGVYEFTLKGGETETIDDVPHGCCVEVTEKTDDHDYTVTHQLGPDTAEGATCTLGAIDSGDYGVTFINTKNITIDTGVDLDTLPYLLTFLGAFGAGALWLMISRRRRTQA